MNELPDTTGPTTRMTTRGIHRNYAEDSDASGSHNREEAMDTDEGVFRVPQTPSMRGRKRRATDDSGGFNLEAPKRGRPRGGGVGSRGGRGGGRRSAGSTSHAETPLFGAVKYNKDPDQAVDDWIARYEEDTDAGIVELQQFLLSSCGCRGQLTAEMLLKMDYSEIIRLMTEEFDEESGEYPMIMAGAQWKRFRHNFSTLIMTVISKCKSSIIFDGHLMDAVIQLLTGLADSQVRAFRHTATFAAMKLSSALVDVTVELNESKNRNQKQMTAERNKIKAMGGAAGSDKLDVLIALKDELEGHVEEVREMLKYVFRSVFVHRYRDVLPDIRAICVSELGNWMLVYPEHFLDDSYLKYIGWTLYDKVPDVRYKCVAALLPLYQRTDVVSKLELFTAKFQERLVSMVSDKDNETAVKACALMTAIYRAFPTLLTAENCIPIYELVYALYRPLAVAAGEFLNMKVFLRSEESTDTLHENPNKRLIIDLIHFFIEGECHEHGAYLVDALFDTNDMIRDWAAYVEVLKSDEANDIDSQLIEVMCCAVRQAATGEHPVGRSMVKRGQAATSKETRILAAERTNISEVFIPTLPMLINRYIADRDKILNLVSLPLYFQLEMYLASDMTQRAVELMKALELVVEKHPDKEVISQVAEVVQHLTSCSGTAQVTDTARSKLLDGLVLQVRVQVDRVEKEEMLDEDDEAALKSAFRKVLSFASAIDPHKQDVFDKCMQVVHWGESRAPAEVIQCSVQYMSLTLHWDLSRLTREQETNRNEAVRKLRKRLDQFFSCCEQIMSEHVSGLETTFLSMCDIMLVFNDQMVKRYEHLKTLMLNLDVKVMRRLKNYVTDNVFMHVSQQFDQQEQVELMMKRRRLLANFSKLVIHGVIPVSEAAEMFAQYVKYYTDFGDIIKTVLHKCRDLDMMATARAIGKAMRITYENIRASSRQAEIDPLSDEFTQLRELAKRLAPVFGNDHFRNREAVASIHRNGVVFALDIENGRASRNPQNVSFLEILIEFSPKLLKQDKICILRYLEKHAAAMGKISTDTSKWSSYALYKDSLKEKTADDASSVRSFAPSSINTTARTAVSTTPTRRGRPPKNAIRGTPTPSESSWER